MISIIIPTLNEEKLLPRLLENIKNQTCKDYEVIIADANSTDRTRDIAREYGCIVVDGGLPGVGRNNGAKVAKGDFFIFFDSDVTITPNFLENAFKEFQRRYLEVASADVSADSLSEKDYKAAFNLYNAYVHYSQYISPVALGVFIMVTRRLFFRIKGFNEKIKLGEDYDFVERAGKLAKFRVLKSVDVKISLRRMEKEGVFRFVTRNIRSELYRNFVGNITDDRFKYEFGNYNIEKDNLNKQKLKLKELFEKLQKSKKIKKRSRAKPKKTKKLSK